MGYPIPQLTEDSAAPTLSRLYLNLERSAPCPDGHPPHLLVTLPPAWANKYQILLYGGAARHRFAVAGVTTPEDLDHVTWPGPIVLHAHWFAALFQGAANRDEAAAVLDRIQQAILRFRDRTGARLVWTAHNVFPHGNQFPDAFLDLRQWTFDTFDAIHVMDDTHLPVLEAAYDRPAPQAFTVPHMLYTGTQSDSVDRAAARAQFGLPMHGTVFGYFGSIQAYKQIPLIIEALDRMRADRPVHALMGGLPVDSTALRTLQARIGTRRDVTLLPRKIQDHEIQYLHHAADVMVLPYAETLNSGAAMMAATFRRPFLMPRGPAAQALEALGGLTYDATAPHGLADGMAQFTRPDAPPAQIDDQAWATRQPAAISDRFFAALRALP